MEPKEIPLSESGLVKPNQDAPKSDPYHLQSDVDSSQVAQHHTIGISQNQVNPGTHVHDGLDSRQIPDLENALGDIIALSGAISTHTHVGGNGADIPNYTDSVRGTWFPSWIGATGNPTLGNGQLNGDYFRVGPMMFVTLWLQFGGTSFIGSGFYSFGNLPAAPALVGAKNMLYGMVFNNTKRWPCAAPIENNRIDRVVVADDKAGGTPLLGSTGWNASGWVTGDYIYLSGFYWT